MAAVLLICKLFSAGFFGVTKRPPKADYTKVFTKDTKKKKIGPALNSTLHFGTRERKGH